MKGLRGWLNIKKGEEGEWRDRIREHFATTKAFCRRLGDGEVFFYDGFLRNHRNCRSYSELQMKLLYRSLFVFEIVRDVFV